MDYCIIIWEYNCKSIERIFWNKTKQIDYMPAEQNKYKEIKRLMKYLYWMESILVLNEYGWIE